MLKDKTEVFVVFKNLDTFIIKQTGLRLKCLRTTNEESTLALDLQILVQKNGIKRELTTPYNPTSKGMANDIT